MIEYDTLRRHVMVRGGKSNKTMLTICDKMLRYAHSVCVESLALLSSWQGTMTCIDLPFI